ncbi:beta-glucanase [Streptomyces sp. NPDC101160]|uniref:beta-glucanase n=1 Tax=Streptomyces sp. NPDC101160 TaxID=3366118 RepID=UPI0037F171C5
MTTWPPADEPVFTADFDSREQWTAGRSWAYPGGGPINPGDNKLDYLTADPAYTRGGVFRATRRPDGKWDTGLLTTEGAPGGFELRTGDTLEARVRLPEETGAWPAIWTWRDGGSEVDVFEYHPDNPDLLELSNHVRGTYHYHRSPTVSPGAWIRLRAEFGARSVTWWLDDTEIFSDDRGVGRGWRADLIVNLSVCAGRYHPAPPPEAEEMSYEVGELRVYRSAGGGWPGWPVA